MKSWHIGVIIGIIAVYILGATFPAPVNMLKSKIGM